VPGVAEEELCVKSALEFWVFLPQMRMTMEQLVDRARAAEAAGFGGVASMDHLIPPGSESSPMFEAMITSAWLAGKTDRLNVGSLVLCDSFRHPAVLARESVSIDHASGGRFELGIRALWAGETLDYQGEHFTLRGAQQQPGPLTKIPIVIGGAGKGTMRLVAEHADWWNVHVGIIDKLEEMRPLSGTARCSLQVQVALVPPSGSREEIARAAHRRFGPAPIVGTASELVDIFGSLSERGVERVYVWFCDFAPPLTLAAFGETVIGPLGLTTEGSS
jgi:alkanesulfonate monooxygenase SsuD/methylene tetrahydromethanopterin reductase-like flavin-dependent oxidoreductase (luciferase family)